MKQGAGFHKKSAEAATRAAFFICIALIASICFVQAAHAVTFGELHKRVAADGALGDYFGYSVAMSGDFAVVGAYLDDDHGEASGSAYVLYRNQGGTNNWGQIKKLTAYDGAANDFFGYSVSISGDYAIVGAYGDDAASYNFGSAYVFYRNEGGANNWGLVTKLTAFDGAANDWFGRSVSISGDIAVVGAYGDGTYAGAAYVFYRNQGGADNWGLVKKLTASDAATYDWFGESVSISGDFLVVGAPDDDDLGSLSGAAYVFYRNQGGADNWGQAKKLTAFDGATEEYFGNSVSINGDFVVVGAPYDDDVTLGTNSGSVYVFDRSQGGTDNWGLVRKLTASDAAAGNWFGKSVSLGGDFLIVGASGDDDLGSISGSAYVFDRNQDWSQIKKLTASDGAANDYFGNSVSISGDFAVVGAYEDDDLGTQSGSAYVFIKSREAYIGLFRDGYWTLDGNGNGEWDDGIDLSFEFGAAGDIPVAGDWNGDWTAEIGIFNNGTWYLDMDGNGRWDAELDRTVKFGTAGDIPIAGDWDGNGTTDAGVFRAGVWYLDSDGTPGWQGGSDTVLTFGWATDIPVSGDWDGNGTTDVGVFRKGWWYLDSDGTPGWQAGSDTALSLGWATDIPVSGDWDGNGTTDAGVFRKGWWYLDSNGTPGWQGGSDTAFSFGQAGDVPVPGAYGGLKTSEQSLAVCEEDLKTCLGTAQVPRTGQTTSYAAGDDGELEMGISWPNPRFTDNANGTVTDNLTKLIWLKNANCASANRSWANALADVVQLNTGGTMNGNNCGDTSNGGSHRTDWRLPNVRELQSLIHFGIYGPAVPSTAGTGKWSAGDPFTGVQSASYWSSTGYSAVGGYSWLVDMNYGLVSSGNHSATYYVWPVRGGE